MLAPSKNFRQLRGFILSTAAEPQRSFEQGMLAPTKPDADRKAGTVCGKLANGQYTPYNPAGADGSQNFAGILKEGQIISADPTRHTFFCRDGEVKADELVYEIAVTAPQKAAVEAAMAAAGIIVRPGI